MLDLTRRITTAASLNSSAGPQPCLVAELVPAEIQLLQPVAVHQSLGRATWRSTSLQTFDYACILTPALPSVIMVLCVDVANAGVWLPPVLPRFQALRHCSVSDRFRAVWHEPYYS